MDDTRGVYSLADLLGNFPDSREAVALIGAALRIAGVPVAEGEDDGRRVAILELLQGSTSTVRTRVCVLAGVLAELAATLRSFALEVKAEQNDPDISSGDAVVTPDGWLVVTMAGKEIGRVPYDPRREGDDVALSESMLREFVRLHGRGDLEVADFKAQLPKAGKRGVVAIMRDDPSADDTGPPVA